MVEPENKRVIRVYSQLFLSTPLISLSSLFFICKRWRLEYKTFASLGFNILEAYHLCGVGEVADLHTSLSYSMFFPEGKINGQKGESENLSTRLSEKCAKYFSLLLHNSFLGLKCINLLLVFYLDGLSFLFVYIQ